MPHPRAKGKRQGCVRRKFEPQDILCYVTNSGDTPLYKIYLSDKSFLRQLQKNLLLILVVFFVFSGKCLIWAQNAAPELSEEFINKIKTNDEFARKWGDLGPIYGRQWRRWSVRNKINSETGEFFLGNQYIDQIFNLIKDLHENPDSRRLMVNAWNVDEIDDT